MCVAYITNTTEERKMDLRNDNKGIVKAFSMVLQIALTMLAPLLVTGWFGLWLNEKFDTTIWFLVMMGFGVLASFRNFFQLMRQFYEKDLKRENKEQEYFEELKRERERRKEER